ncbi:hypothetical protein [Lutibacter maritimus]|uniref:Uncharacterized protein n=1 Tax=Lutibacter maritimus TaxID=593133 RepID=A0A1I6SR28_9FLAO|nr:hypothetical protein [Lutibacter maritimus]SFS79421.1 hypothetical protein SAMN04488006_0069 [Lutibacter maritimus]
MTNIPIYTIQFLDISFTNRETFLKFMHDSVIEFVNKHKTEFGNNGINVQYFHNTSKKPVPSLIHCLTINTIFTIRAYSQTRIDALKYWFVLFKEKHPELCENCIESTEKFQFKLHPTKTFVYTSDNWIPFNACVKTENNFYIDKNKKGVSVVPKDQLKSRLLGNLSQFLESLSINVKEAIQLEEDKYKLFKIEKYPTKHNTTIALTRNENGKIIAKDKISFKINILTNYELPSYFSIGQNVSYGNGVFIRNNTKTKHNETTKANIKPIKMV